MHTVLVVDDEAALVELLDDVLTAAGYRVVTAPNGEKALGVFAKIATDVIVSDSMMPVIDGYMLLESVRQGTMGVRIVLTSAARLRVDFLPQPDTFVSKPYTLDHLDAVANPVEPRLTARDRRAAG